MGILPRRNRRGSVSIEAGDSHLAVKRKREVQETPVRKPACKPGGLPHEGLATAKWLSLVRNRSLAVAAQFRKPCETGPVAGEVRNSNLSPERERGVQRKLRLVPRAKIICAVLLGISCLAQDPVSLVTPEISRVGSKLTCRCGVCRNTVGDCPMLRCKSAEPMRKRIKAMQEQGQTDKQIIDSIVQEQGIVALAAPPVEGIGLLAWFMPGIALLVGFLVVFEFLKRKRAAKTGVPVSAADEKLLERYRDQIEHDLEDPSPEERDIKKFTE